MGEKLLPALRKLGADIRTTLRSPWQGRGSASPVASLSVRLGERAVPLLTNPLALIVAPLYE